MRLMEKHTRPSMEAVLLHYGAQIVPARGGWAALRCPFHGDTHASATVNTEAGKFHCHGCDVRGDVYDLIQAQENCDLRRALEIGDTLTPDNATRTSKGQRSLGKNYTPPGRRGRKD